ncbi:putative ribonuclease H-like domain-containing protein, partial [Tanacetum coccineum]
MLSSLKRNPRRRFKRWKIQAIEAMQEELIQFELQNVWTLVDLPNGKSAIRTKWYSETRKMREELLLERRQDWLHKVTPKKKSLIMMSFFAPVARIEAIRFYFLAYASFIGFIVYQMDVKSAFLYGTIKEEKDKGISYLSTVYVDDIIFGSTKKSLCDEFKGLMHKRFQMSSIGELTFFLGLQAEQTENRIFISQDKYVAEILKKFDFAIVKTASTSIKTNKALVKDEEVEAVDVHLYRSMIGSLMYLTAFRHDITFAVCACVRFQVTPKTSHIHAVKRIFRYFKGQHKLGLWYPRDSSFNLEAFSDSDYAGASLDRKSTTGGCQFLGKRLISWQCKKQTIVANSTTKAEYVVAANCCGQIRLSIRSGKTEWKRLPLLYCYPQLKARAEQWETSIDPIHQATLNESFPQGTGSVNTLGSGEDGMKLIELMEHYTKLSELLRKGKERYSELQNRKRFWASAKAKIVNEEQQIQALVDKKNVIITETSIRSDLKLDDAKGIDCLPTASIFAELERMGLQEKVLDLEKAKTAQAKEITSIKKRVKQ